MDVFDLSAKLSLDKSEYDKGLSDAKEKGTSWGNVLSTAGKGAVAGITAVGTAIAGITTATVAGVSKTAEYGDTIDKTAQKLGLSNKAYQEWDYVLNLAGTSMQNMGTGLKTLTNKIDDAKNGSDTAQAMFTKLGISMEDLSKMSREEVFEATIKGFQGMADSTERASLANDLFGKSGQELTPLFNTTATETEALIKNLNEMGAVMSDEAVKASADFEDALTTLQTSIGGLKNGALSEFLPACTSIMEGLTQVFTGDNSGLGKVNEGITSFVDNLAKMLPKMADFGTSVITTLAEAILSNLPQIIQTASKIVMDLAQALIKNLPQIVKTGLEVIVSLAKGIGEQLPKLIPTIVDVVLEIVDTLIDNVDLLIDGAVALIIGLAEGLIDALPKLIDKVPQIVMKLTEAIIKNAPKLLEGALKLILTLANGLIENLPKLITYTPKIVSSIVNGIINSIGEMRKAGTQLIDGLWNGIKEKWETLKSNVSNLGKNLVAEVKSIFGIHSPSKVFEQIGEYCIEGLQIGSDELFGDSGLTAKVTADVADNTTGKSDILALLESYLPTIAMGQNIYLDGDTLVSGTAKRMDLALGRLNARRV